MDGRTTRSIIEDLLPLYSEGLLRDETVQWLERQARDNPDYRKLLDQASQPLPAPKPEMTTDYEAMMRSTKRKLSVMQLIFVALSFFVAMSTSMMGGSFGFILWYAVLGGVTYLFYRDWRLVLLVSFVPIFLWIVVDTMQAWVQGSVEGTGFLGFLMMALGGSLLGAVLHVLFALLGMAIVRLAVLRKPLTVALSIVLALGVLVTYDAYNGNPVSKWLAAQKLQAYLKETYPEEELLVRDGLYSFKDASYEFRVVAVGKPGADGKAKEYRFTVRGLVPRVIWDGVYHDRLDEPLMKRLGEEAAQEIRALLEPEIPGLRGVHVHLEVLEGTLPGDTAWRKDLPLAAEPQIDLTLDANGLAEEDVRTIARQIQAKLNESGYVYRSVLINANVFPDAEAKELGPLKYATSFRQEEDLTDLRVRTFHED